MTQNSMLWPNPSITTVSDPKVLGQEKTKNELFANPFLFFCSGQAKGFFEMAEEEEKRAQARAAANLLEDIDYLELDTLIDRAAENVVSVMAVPAVQSVCDYSFNALEEGGRKGCGSRRCF